MCLGGAVAHELLSRKRCAWSRAQEGGNVKVLVVEGQRHQPLDDSKSAEIRERMLHFFYSNSGS